MNVHYPIQLADGTHPKTLVPHANQVNNTISIYINIHPFEILTDEQVVVLMYAELYTANIPVCSVDDMLHNTAPRDYFS